MLGVVLSIALILSQEGKADDAFVVQDPTSHLALTVASEGHTDKGLPTCFFVYAFPHTDRIHVSLADRGGLPADATFTNMGDGRGRFVWSSPEVGTYHLIFQAGNGQSTVQKPFTLEVGDYGYPPENAGPIIKPPFPPPASAEVIHVSVAGTPTGAGTEADPTTVREALERARKAIAPDKPVYILFRRGDRWEGVSDFSLSEDTTGYRNAPIVFASYGPGEEPYFQRLFAIANIEYLHFQDIQFHEVVIKGNKFHEARDDVYPGTSIPRVLLDERLTVQRLRFHRCRIVAGGVMWFLNTYANAGNGSRVPEPNTWWGGGPLAGMTRDIEICHCVFEGGGPGDAINFTAPDRGVWIHHNIFRDSGEEHIDISGGTGHIVEYNLGLGSRINNGIKLHSQFSLLTDSTVRFNTTLYAGGWNSEVVGGGGNAFVAENVMGCYFGHNDFISRWSACYGDMDRPGDRAYYGTFAGNIIEDNVHGGGVQIIGRDFHVLEELTFRNRFKGNFYRPWPGAKTLIRFWSDPMRVITLENFHEWQSLPVSDETVGDLAALFVDPFLPEDPNAPLDLDNPGDWRRR